MNETLESESKSPQPAYQTIADSLRNDILSGKLPPGSLLPSTEDFATTWNSSYFTIHTALKSLVKEGWVERIHGRGTYVAQPDKRFLHAGIFHSLNIWSDEEATFQRRLNDCLVEKFHQLGKTTQIIIDSRPESEQTEMFPPLGQAIFRRQIQCVISTNVNSKNYPILSKLTIPTAFLTAHEHHPGVDFDEVGFIKGAVRSLAEQGCRTIGFITNVPVIDGNFRQFMREVKANDAETRPEWMIQPDVFQTSLIEYGFHAFRRLWKLPARPQGLVIFPDVAARGVILAALQAGVRAPEEMKFVLHRNAHVPLLCPFPVTWATANEYDAADGLVASIEHQFAGRRAPVVHIPYTFEHDDAARWRS